MSYNKLWTFGCSFTEGGGLDGHQLQLHERQDWYHPEYMDMIWPVLLSKQLNLQLENKGINGSGVMQTVYSLLRDIKHFKKGDIVIASLTSPCRFLLYNNVFKDEPEWGVHGISTIPPHHEVVDRYLNSKSLEFKEEDFHSSVDAMTVEQQEILAKYVLMFNFDKVVGNGWYPKKRHELTYTQADAEWELAKNLVESLGIFLRSIGIEFYTWSYYLWYRGQSWPGAENQFFESIIRWSEWGSTDGHWSPNGHKTVAEFFKWCIDREEYNMSGELCDEWARERVHKSKDWRYRKVHDRYIKYGEL